MKHVKKILRSKWIILLVLIIAAYCYGAVYENTATTPVDEFGSILLTVTADEAFVNDHQDKNLGMSLDQYRASLGNISILKSRFLQGPLNFLCSCLAFAVSVLLIQIAVRLQERLRKIPQKTTILETLDVTFPFLLAEALKYFFFAVYALTTRTLVEYHLLIAATVSVIGCAVPYCLNFLHRRNTGRPVAGVLIMGALISAVNFVIQML